MIQSMQYLIDHQINRLQQTREAYSQYTAKGSEESKNRETVSVSREGLTYLESERLIASITQLDGRPVIPLKAEDNVLTLRDDVFYSYNDGNATYIWGMIDGKFLFPHEAIEKEYGVSLSDFSLDYLRQESSQWHFFDDFICGGIFFLLHQDFTGEERLSGLASIGIEPGWITYEGGGKSHKAFMTEEGTVFPEYQIESSRRAMNSTNWFTKPYRYDENYVGICCTKDTIFLINGIEYKLDENGRLNLPYGTPVLPTTTGVVQIINPGDE